MDRWLLGATLALCFIGAVMVFSASAVTAREQFGHPYVFLLRQLVWLVLGLAGMVLLMNVDYRRLREPAVVFPALFSVLVLLVAVFFADKSHATHRWLRLGPLSLQPAEMAKLVVILYLAWFLEMKRRTKASLEFNREDLKRTLLPAMAPVMAILVLVLMQPDLGTPVEMLLIATAILVVAGISWKSIAVGAGAAAPAVYLLIQLVSYRHGRIGGFVHPQADPLGRSFQLLQSLIAVGSGGFSGVGLMESKQKLFYLPEAHTDFIYAVLCEELGFIGGVLLVSLFIVYGWRGMRAAWAAPDGFGRLLALGVTSMVLSQALINFSVVLGMMPTKGIPLPFVSYGGSSLLTMLLATGVLLNISQQATD
jgi:cell division protein FtsW